MYMVLSQDRSCACRRSRSRIGCSIHLHSEFEALVPDHQYGELHYIPLFFNLTKIPPAKIEM